MSNYIERKEKLQQELKPYYREKINLRLKYAALISIVISIILLLLPIMGIIDIEDTRTILLVRGFAGVFAIIFAVLVCILVYRVNKAYLRDRYRSDRPDKTL